HVTGITAGHLARGVAEGIPDGRRAPARRSGAFDLVGGRCRAPAEVCREAPDEPGLRAGHDARCTGSLRGGVEGRTVRWRHQRAPLLGLVLTVCRRRGPSVDAPPNTAMQ